MTWLELTDHDSNVDPLQPSVLVRLCFRGRVCQFRQQSVLAEGIIA